MWIYRYLPTPYMSIIYIPGESVSIFSCVLCMYVFSSLFILSNFNYFIHFNSLLVWYECWVIKHCWVTGAKLLFHLVQFICAHCVEVISLQLLIEHGWVHESANVDLRAFDPISNRSLVYWVMEVGITYLIANFLYFFLLLSIPKFVMLKVIPGVGRH